MYTGSLAPFSNREDWVIEGPLIDDDGTAVTLTGATIVFYLTRPKSGSAVLTGTTDNGRITLPTATSFQIAFTPDEVGELCAGTYDAYLRVTIAGVTTQIIAGSIQVVEGGPK